MNSPLELPAASLLSPRRSLPALMEGKPAAAATVFFAVSNAAITSMFCFLLKAQLPGLERTLINPQYVLSLFLPKLLFPALSVVIIHFLSRVLFGSKGDLKTFYASYLCLLAVPVIAGGLLNIGLYWLVLSGTAHAAALAPFNLAAKAVNLIWTLAITITVIIAVYRIRFWQSLLVWAAQMLPFVVFSHYFRG